MLLDECLNSIDADALRAEALASPHFPSFCVDNFLKQPFASELVAGFPSYEESFAIGRTFKTVNERGKVQITDSSKFPPAVAKLNDVLASPDFLAIMSHAMGIPNLLADKELVGGGIHQTGPRGHLDVHVDFNYIEERQLHRRINILLYLNEGWREEWGGAVELWDPTVTVCHKRFSPIFNRCVVFETNEISFHGVTAVTCPPGVVRRSFAAYYYTTEAPAHWSGRSHTTLFKARPNEVLKGAVLMPVEKMHFWLQGAVRRTKAKIFG